MNLVFLFKKLIKHELITGSFYLFLATMASNVLAFLLNLFLVRRLSLNGDYGVFASLLSVITLLSIPAQSLNTIIVQFATKFFALNQKEKAAKLYKVILQAIVIVGFILFLFFAIFANQIGGFLQIRDTGLVILVGVIAAFSYISIVNTAFLQSLFKFGLVSFFLFLSTVLKFTFGVFFVLIGFRVGGVLWALIIMLVVPFLLGFIPVRFLLKKARDKSITVPIKDIFFYAIPASVGILSLSSFTSTDIILVKHFFSPEKAELYAGIALIGKIIFYFTMPIPMVMFPLVIKKYNAGESFKSLFQLAILLVAVPSTCLTLFYIFFPSLSIGIVLGLQKYQKVYQYLGLFGLYLTIFSILNVFVMFFLSLRQTKISYLIAVGACLQIILISLFHKSFFEIIGNSLLILVLLLIALLLYYLKKYGKESF